MNGEKNKVGVPENTLSMRIVLSVGLLLCLALVLLPRFNRQDIGPLKEHVVGRGTDGGQSMGDAPEYIRAVQYYRGLVSRDQLVTPFAYRVGVPYVAALLPVKDPMTALNSINGVALALALVFLHGFLRTLGYDFKTAAVGCFLFVFSFPVFYYGAIGLVDPVGLTVLAAGLFFLYRQQWLWLCGVAMLGACIRETTFVLVVVTATYLLVTRPKNRLLILVGVTAAFMLPTIGIRMVFHDLPHYSWSPFRGYLQQNLRLRAVVAMVLSLGVPGLLTLVWLMQVGRGGGLAVRRGCASATSVWLPMLVGIGCVAGLSAFAVVAAYADGRFLWAVSIFGAPFALDVLRGGRGGRTGFGVQGVEEGEKGG